MNDTTVNGTAVDDDTDDDLPTQLTKLLRNVDGVHTVYATKPLVPSIIGAVVEAVRNEPVGMHLVTVTEKDDGIDVTACIGVSGDESASVICRRAHDALRAYLRDNTSANPVTVSVKIGRVG
jgi:hypothetical protein